MTSRLTALAGGLAFATLAACSKSDVDSAQNAVASAVPVIAHSAGTVARIEASFVRIDAASAVATRVAVDGDGVRLSGKVRSAAIEQRFVAAARATQGVNRVTSTLAVDASLPNATQDARDFALDATVRAKLVEQTGVNGITIAVSARDGVVTLSGTVPSQAVASTIVANAKGVAGVKSVVDRLQVHS